MTQPVNDPTTLSIDAQDAWLMVSANYGDEQTKRMTASATRVRGNDNLFTE